MKSNDNVFTKTDLAVLVFFVVAFYIGNEFGIYDEVIIDVLRWWND